MLKKRWIGGIAQRKQPRKLKALRKIIY